MAYAQHCFAQVNTPLSNLRTKKIAVDKTPVQLDSLSIIPGTVKVFLINDSIYSIDYTNARLIWKSLPPVDSVIISYRIFPKKLNTVYKRFEYSEFLTNVQYAPLVFNNSVYDENKGTFNFGSINYNGSFGRSVSFGNSQDPVLTSSLNLQLKGIIGDSLELSAAITDNNIPIQPDGNTQQLNEFDRIYIQVKKRNWQLSLGDIDIRKTDSYFLNFYKRLQGASFQVGSKIFKQGYQSTLISGAVAKGKFARNIFQGLEGNQGPYRLQGNNGEQFFTVLANTERVFIDGELLQRGEDQDYVINYNTAEITFTPKRMINKDRRIQVEFEYADRNYLTAQLILSHELQLNKKFTFRLNAFSNSDAKNTSINQTLDDDQKFFLSQIGDSLQKAIYPIVPLDTAFSNSKILYEKLDSVVSGVTYLSVYRYSTNPQNAKYNPSFVEVGFGNGDYVLDQNTTSNGRTYKWVKPENGVKSGNFVIGFRLVAPRSQQVVSAGIDYYINDNNSIKAELAYSNLNLNTFSRLNKEDNKGYAARIMWQNEQAVFKSTQKNLKLISKAGFEFVDKKFRPLERLRSVEFSRDWSLPFVNDPQEEKIGYLSVQLLQESRHSVKAELQTYNRGDVFKGNRQVLQHYYENKGWVWNGIFNITNTDSGITKGNFLRPTLDLKKKFKDFEVGGSYALEKNNILNKASDTLNPFSFSFDITQLYIRSLNTNTKWSFTYFTRRDKIPVKKQFQSTDRSQNFSAGFEWNAPEDKHQIRLNATLRQLQIINENLTNKKAENSLIGRTEYRVNELNGFITGELLYELGAGQEQKRQFSFIEVPAGQGEYTWIDYNNNNVKELNEFELALYPDQAKYIRLFTPTNEFVKANYTQFNYSLSLLPRSIIHTKNAKGLKLLASKMSINSSWQIAKKQIADGDFLFNPFVLPQSDTSLISLTSILTNTFFFNRTNSVWGFDFTQQSNKSRTILTFGLETRTLRNYFFKSRYNIGNRYLAELSLKQITNILENQNAKFGNRNYNVVQQSVEPKLSYVQATIYRISMSYRFEQRKNTIGVDGEKALSNALLLEAQYNSLSNTSLNAKFQYNAISFNNTKSNAPANTNSTIGYVMLDGLLPGKNLLWSVELVKRLSNIFQINLRYEGRRAAASRTVHLGNASIVALF